MGGLTGDAHAEAVSAFVEEAELVVHLYRGGGWVGGRVGGWVGELLLDYMGKVGGWVGG